MDIASIVKSLEIPAKNVHKIKRYAILIPLVEHEGKLEILYEVRSQYISQGGEVSFPGGKIEEGELAREAALRETGEELGILASDIELLGESDYYENESVKIVAYVGKLKNNDWKSYQYSKDEVEYLFSVPIEYLMILEPKRYLLKGKISEQINPNFPFQKIKNGENYSWRGMNKEVYFYELGEKYPIIWGVTASLTHGFIEKLKKAIKGVDKKEKRC